jgi:hypothetical protein
MHCILDKHVGPHCSIHGTQVTCGNASTLSMLPLLLINGNRTFGSSMRVVGKSRNVGKMNKINREAHAIFWNIFWY